MRDMLDILRDALGGGALTTGLMKMTIDDIIAQYEGIVTINGVDMRTDKKGEQYPVFTFLEDERCYFSGGTALRNMVNNAVAKDFGSVAAMSQALKVRPARIFLNKIRTKDNMPYTAAAVLNDVPAANPSHDPPINLETGEIPDE